MEETGLAVGGAVMGRDGQERSGQGWPRADANELGHRRNRGLARSWGGATLGGGGRGRDGFDHIRVRSWTGMVRDGARVDSATSARPWTWQVWQKTGMTAGRLGHGRVRAVLI